MLPPPSSSLPSIPAVDELSHNLSGSLQLHDTADKDTVPKSSKDSLVELLNQVDSDDLKLAMKHEIRRMMNDHERLVTILQQRSEVLERENNELRNMSAEHQRRYEKAVREMQFFRHKYDRVAEATKQQTRHRRSLSIESGSSGEIVMHIQQPTVENTPLPQQQQQQQKHDFPPPPPPPLPSYLPQQHLQSYPLTPTSPQPSTLPAEDGNPPYNTPIYDPNDYIRQKASLPSRSSSTSTNSSSVASAGQHWPGGHPPAPYPPSEPAPPVPRLRQNSTSASTHSTQSSSTDHSLKHDGVPNRSLRRKRSWQHQSPPQPPQSPPQPLPPPQQQLPQLPLVPQLPPSIPPPAPLQAPQQPPPPIPAMQSAQSIGSLSVAKGAIHAVAMSSVRSTTAANGYTGASVIQQRRVDPLIFGGSDGLWETIAKSKGSDVTVEKIISNFLRRGGSPNTAKQSPSSNAVKMGYGMIHALVVTKAPGSLDLLLQQGANPNAMTLSPVEDDKVTPCYLAASVGWLTGLQKLVQAGGDLVAARGEGIKNKTVLHVAAEHCHAAVVEYVVEVTQGALNLEQDSNGATVLHYACASGHTDLVSFLAKSCNIPVNQADRRGELPLHWAARNGRLEVVTLLVERCGCDFNAYVPRKVGTPLDLAKLGGHKRLVDYLKGLGAMTAKKVEKKREEEMIKEVPKHLESTLSRNGLFGDNGMF